MNYHQSETARLRERVAQLEEELRQCRETFWSDDGEVFQLRHKLGLAPLEAKVLSILLRRDFVRREQLHLACHGSESEVHPRIFDVVLTRIRKKTGINIANMSGGFWYLPQRKQIAAEIFKGKEPA